MWLLFRRSPALLYAADQHVLPTGGCFVSFRFGLGQEVARPLLW